jgi:hypothetical protein
MSTRLLVAWLVVFVAWMAGSFVVHGVLLHDDYARLGRLFRSEAESQHHFPVMILAHVMLAGAFVWIYSRGVENKPLLSQGLRFGLVVAFLTVVPTYLIYFVVQPMPPAMVIRQIMFDTILLLILGVIVAFVYRAPGRT